jgi:FkbM family methyltransferase
MDYSEKAKVYLALTLLRGFSFVPAAAPMCDFEGHGRGQRPGPDRPGYAGIKRWLRGRTAPCFQGGNMSGIVHWVRNKARRSLDDYAPFLSRAYRSARDAFWISRPVKTSYGFWLYAPPRFHKAVWEKAERTVFERELKHATICVDVGANIGIYSCMAGLHGKHVVAIEPLLQNLKFLYKNLLKNGFRDCEVFPVGVGAVPGIGIISGFSDVASFVSNWTGGSKAQSQAVAISTLDIILGARFAGETLFIKIDVEGFELEVLEGATNILRQNPKPVWMVEIIPRNLLTGRENPAFEKTFQIFFDNGYRAFLIEETCQEIAPDEVASMARRQNETGAFYCNFLFLHAASERLKDYRAAASMAPSHEAT